MAWRSINDPSIAYLVARADREEARYRAAEQAYDDSRLALQRSVCALHLEHGVPQREIQRRWPRLAQVTIRKMIRREQALAGVKAEQQAPATLPATASVSDF